MDFNKLQNTLQIENERQQRAYLEKYDEIERRAEIHKEVIQGTYEEEEQDENKKIEIFEPPNLFPEKNRIILVNLGHKNQCPISSRPCLRILGAFDSKEEALDHIDDYPEKVKKVTIHTVSPAKKFMICESFEKQMDPSYALEKITVLSRKHAKQFDFRKNVFERRLDSTKQAQSVQDELKALKRKREMLEDEKEQLEIDEKINALNQERVSLESISKKLDMISKKTEQEQKENTDSKNVIQKPKGEGIFAKKVPRYCEVRKQNVAVITVIPDTDLVLNSSEPEPAVIIWGLFENTDSAKQWIETSAKSYIFSYHLDVVDCYEWLFPMDVNVEEIDEEYRSKTLTEVMKKRKHHPKEVQEQMQRLRMQNIERVNEGVEPMNLPFKPYREDVPDNETLDQIMRNTGYTDAMEVKVVDERVEFCDNIEEQKVNPQSIEIRKQLKQARVKSTVNELGFSQNAR